MRRTIKFRGKSLRGGEWFYGNLFDKDTRGRTHISTTERGCLCIDPDTIGQFTGLTDSNGKEIYEGDILECPKVPNLPLEVYYNVKNGAFCLAEHTHTECIQYGTAPIGEMLMYYPDMHVVGNIHDIPDLLTDKLNK